MSRPPTRRPFASWSPLRRALSAIAALVLVAAVTAEALDTGFAPTTAATVVTGLLCVGALFVPPRRSWAAGLVAVAASGALSLATTRLSERPEHTPGLVETCALLLVMARSVRRHSLPRMVPLVAGAWLATPLVLLRLPGTEYPHAVAYGAPVLFLVGPLAIVLGLYLRLLDAGREREDRARLQAQRMEYARELHDFVGHHLTAITAQVKALRFTSAAGRPPAPETLDAALAGIEEAGSQAMDSLRTMVGIWRRPEDGAPLQPARGLAGLHELAASFGAGGPAVDLTIDPALAGAPPSPPVAAVVHRVVQESLTNVRKHAAGAGTVTVDVRAAEADASRLTVCVSDDTPRPSPASAGGAGFGLVGLTERVEALGGNLHAGPGPEAGWRVRAELPLRGTAGAVRTTLARWAP